jgi:hypothetical protein
MRATLGQAGSHWDLALALPDGTRREFKDLPCDPAWQQARWVGFSSPATSSVAYYLDDLVIENR